jgi:DNA-binding response OmpR family regulator
MNTIILVIENRDELVANITATFKNNWAEAEIHVSARGRSGVEVCKTIRPEAIVLDLDLPDISGLEVLREIRFFSAAPVIVVGQYSTEKEAVEAFTEDATDYVAKPLRYFELLARVQSHVNRWKINEIRALAAKRLSTPD